MEPKARWVFGDFNGLFGEILCLSHRETCERFDGTAVVLSGGMVLTAFQEDGDENGNRDDILATGTVEPSPDWLQCVGSRWILRIDGDGIRWESDLQKSTGAAPP